MTIAAFAALTLEQANVVTTKGQADSEWNVKFNNCVESKDAEVKKEGRNEDDENAFSSNKKVLLHQSSSFIRVHDLEGVPEELHLEGPTVSSSTLHGAMRSQGGRSGPAANATAAMFFVDQDLKLVLDQLVQLGFAEATDESSRFTPGRETANSLRRRGVHNIQTSVEVDWPIRPWLAADKRNLNEILVWNGMVRGHKGFGHDWPIVKARGCIAASPRKVVDFLWDSENVRKYNNMSQGRQDGIIFQEGVDTSADESEYGFPGCAKLFKSYNKIKMVPRTVELVSILHARALEPPLAAPGTYIIVNRSIWESDEPKKNASTGRVAPNDNNQNLIRSEILLGVQLLRPLNGGKHCEITTIAHALAPGLNKTIAKAAANVSAAKILRDIQAHASQM